MSAIQDLSECLKYHENQAKQAKQLADNADQTVAKMNRFTFAHDDDYDDVRALYVKQSAFDRSREQFHQKCANAIRLIAQ